jgi:DNA-directed RNA polymerase specialized sigma24 family protein
MAITGTFFHNTTSDLVRLAKAGDAAAFADLLQPEYRMALRMAGGLLQDPDEAEDAARLTRTFST